MLIKFTKTEETKLPKINYVTILHPNKGATRGESQNFSHLFDD
jgi:hypothetical protein